MKLSNLSRRFLLRAGLAFLSLLVLVVLFASNYAKEVLAQTSGINNARIIVYNDPNDNGSVNINFTGFNSSIATVTADGNPVSLGADGAMPWGNWLSWQSGTTHTITLTAGVGWKGTLWSFCGGNAKVGGAPRPYSSPDYTASLAVPSPSGSSTSCGPNYTIELGIMRTAVPAPTPTTTPAPTPLPAPSPPPPPAGPPNKLPVGSLESVINSTCTATGWAYDLDSPAASINIEIFRDGKFGQPGSTFVGQYAASISRPDINSKYGISGNHGFKIDFNFSNSKEAPLFSGSHTLLIYAMDTSGGGNPLVSTPQPIACTPPVVTNQPPNKPVVVGPSTENVNQYFAIMVTATDPQNSQLTLTVDWSDGQATVLPNVNSGQPQYTFHHYLVGGSYKVRAKAKNSLNLESPWSDTLTINVPGATAATCHDIKINGSSADKLDITFVSVNYSDMSQFENDAIFEMNRLLQFQPYSQHQNSFNFHSVEVPNIFPKSLDPSLLAYAFACPTDKEVAIVNASYLIDYPGAAGVSLLGGMQTAIIHPTVPGVPYGLIAHELGHSIGSLFDEYIFAGISSLAGKR